MNKLFLLPFIIFSVLPGATHGQPTTINYGSANGKYISINSTRIYYEEYGKGAPLLLLHGGFGSINDFQKVIPELSRHFRVIAPDSPGHGRSGQADSLSYQLLSSYFSKMIDALALDSVYVLGWSDGGNAALILAADRADKVRKVVVSGANSTTDGLVSGVLDHMKKLTTDYVTSAMKEWLENYKKLSPQKDNWKKFVNDSKKMWFTRIAVPESKLRQIKLPVLVILGDHDIIRLEHGMEMHRLIKGSEFAVLPGTSHATFSQKPEMINKLTVDFLLKK